MPLDSNRVLTARHDGKDAKHGRTSATTANLGPFSLGCFQWQNRRFLLKNPVTCVLDFQDGLWVYECPRYGLHTFSRSRHDALAQFNEEFACLYDGLYDEPDDALTLDAIHLRDVLRNDLETVKVEN